MLSRMAFGFIAGALAVVLFHQGMFAVLHKAGYIANAPWRMAPVPPFGVPTLLNLMFWGGMWGVLFGLIYDAMGDWPGWGKGIVFGMLGPMLLGSWLFVAYLKGNPLFSGFLKDFNPVTLRNSFLLNGIAFGLGIGLLYPLLRRVAGGRG